MRSCSVPGWEQLVTHASSYKLLLPSKKGGRASESLTRHSRTPSCAALAKRIAKKPKRHWMEEVHSRIRCSIDDSIP